MDFIIIANAWSAGRDNPTSKHRIAMELSRRGHRVLWIEGSGMRTPSMGSGHDRLRMVRKVAAAFRGARRETVAGGSTATQQSNPSTKSGQANATTGLWVLSPLFIPLPRYGFVRRLNGYICRWGMRFWGWQLGFRDPVLINYVPVLAEAMRGWRRFPPQLSSCQAAELLSEKTIPKTSTTKQLNNPATALGSPRVVYHCVDRWDQFGMYDSAMMGEMDRRCCVYADLVLASSGELYDRCLRLNPNTVMLTHGVDWEHFRSAVSFFSSEELPGGECVRRDVERHLGQDESEKNGAEHRWLPTSRRQQNGEGDIARQPLTAPIIGFFGLLSEWVDQDLLLGLARAIPEADIVLIGKPDVDVTRLRGVPNIHLAGPKPFAELPTQIARFTVGIIPFVVNDLTRAVNPIKLREMLAAGCPVVSTALPEVEKFSGKEKERTVIVAHNQEEFISRVRDCLAHPLSQEERQSLSDSMSGETWGGKVDEILKLIMKNSSIP